MTHAKAQEIDALIEEGWSATVIRKRLGVAHDTVYRAMIMRGEFPWPRKLMYEADRQRFKEDWCNGVLGGDLQRMYGVARVRLAAWAHCMGLPSVRVRLDRKFYVYLYQRAVVQGERYTVIRQTTKGVDNTTLRNRLRYVRRLVRGCPVQSAPDSIDEQLACRLFAEGKSLQEVAEETGIGIAVLNLTIDRRTIL